MDGTLPSTADLIVILLVMDRQKMRRSQLREVDKWQSCQRHADDAQIKTFQQHSEGDATAPQCR